MIKLIVMKAFFAICLVFLPLFSSQAQGAIKEEARVYREEGYRLQTLGNLDQAFSFYQKAVQMDPTFAEAYNDLGVVYEAKGDLLGALEMYKKVLDIDPSYLPVYTNLAFLYEKKHDIRNATVYWKKRYEFGQEGGYWKEVARQHLLKLGTYPQVKKEMLEEKAVRLSRELSYKREQERLETIEEAKLHFNIGNRAFLEGDYKLAQKEFRTVLSLNPQDGQLQDKTAKLYKETERLYLKQQASRYTDNALEYIDNGDYLSAGQKLKEALSIVLRIAQKK